MPGPPEAAALVNESAADSFPWMNCTMPMCEVHVERGRFPPPCAGLVVVNGRGDRVGREFRLLGGFVEVEVLFESDVDEGDESLAAQGPPGATR